MLTQGSSLSPAAPLPPWFKQKLPRIEKLEAVKKLLDAHHLHTVCQGAQCPNLGQCWERGVATFMILGKVCTRNCRFCAVPHGVPRPPDGGEPLRIARCIQSMGLHYAVITSVTRDDLSDGGASAFSRMIDILREQSPEVKIEVLIPDFQGELKSIQLVLASGPDVVGHNIETVERLYPFVRPQADYKRSLAVLRHAKQTCPEVVLKSGLMLGLGEKQQEVIDTMHDLRHVGCDILTLGQYLAPSQGERHISVERYVTPDEFAFFEREAYERGFPFVLSGPLVRSSFFAEEAFKRARHIKQKGRVFSQQERI